MMAPNGRLAGSGTSKSGSIVRVSTALGSFVIEIINDVGPIADALAAEIESAVLERLRAHRHVAAEMGTVDIQRAEFDYETREG
jgi:hypothetical protein